MWRRMRWAGVAALALLAGACGTSTEMIESWREPSYHPTPMATKVLLVGMGENDRRVKVFEDIMGRHFSARKLNVIPGSSVIPRDSMSLDAFKQLVTSTGADLMVTCRLVGIEQETAYVPGTTSYVPGPGYYGMYPYYYSSYSMVHDPGYVTQYKVYKAESNVYDVHTEKLVWSGLSRTIDPANTEDGVNSLGMTLINELVRAKVIK